MSKIVDFRNNIIEGLKTLFPELNVEWYDGLFDEHDIADWTLKTPCARVAVMNAPAGHTATGELNANLRVVVVIIDENKHASRDGDARAWEYVEKTATWANLNKFGTSDAAAATGIKFRRISQPVLRREGVSVGVVEWQSSLMIGTNQVRMREFLYDEAGQMITQVPRTKVTAQSYSHNEAGISRNETLDLTPEED